MNSIGCRPTRSSKARPLPRPPPPSSSCSLFGLYLILASLLLVSQGTYAQQQTSSENGDTSSTEINFTFDLLASNLCSDSPTEESTLLPDTEQRLADACLRWVDELTTLPPEELLEMRDNNRPELAQDDDFMELFLIEDLVVDGMAITDFVNGIGCDAAAAAEAKEEEEKEVEDDMSDMENIRDDSAGDGVRDRRRKLQRRARSVARVAGTGGCRQCQPKVAEKLRRLFLSSDPHKQQLMGHRLLQRGNITAALIDFGFTDVANVAFENFRIVDCSPTSSDCSECALSESSCGSAFISSDSSSAVMVSKSGSGIACVTLAILFLLFRALLA
mmetsp:Transcript_30620/g.66272  ORF Transcript_30620/g.66272 Transcript_30620/m.66272 type:complete len:331 (+) Transcript_30620:320-1312(+)